MKGVAKARVVNVSMGKPRYSPRACRAIRRASTKTLFLIGAGNSGRRSTYWPARCEAPNTLVVGIRRGAAQIAITKGRRVGLFVDGVASTSEATVYASVFAARIARRHPRLTTSALKRAVLSKWERPVHLGS